MTPDVKRGYPWGMPDPVVKNAAAGKHRYDKLQTPEGLEVQRANNRVAEYPTAPVPDQPAPEQDASIMGALQNLVFGDIRQERNDERNEARRERELTERYYEAEPNVW